MKIAVAIITYNRPGFLGKCLASIASQTLKPSEVIVIDSSDDMNGLPKASSLHSRSAAVAKKFAKKLPLKYKHFRQRLRQCRERNLALENCTTEVIAYIDDDCVADKGWLEGIADGYKNSDAAAVGGPCVNVDANMNPLEKITRSSRNLNRISASGDITCNARRWIPPESMETQALAGGNMSFLAKELREIGGFDEFYDRHAAFREESDPQIALLRKGFSIIYEPKALVWHLAARTGGIFVDSMKDYYFWCGVNHRYLVDKYKFSKFWSRLSWLTFSRNPPSLLLAVALAIARRDVKILQWYKGLFGL